MRPPTTISSLLRQASPRFTQTSFICKRCIHEKAASRPSHQSLRQTPFLKAFRSQPFRSVRGNSTSSVVQETVPLGALSRNTGDSSRVSAKSAFPETSSNTVAYWLLGSAASVFGLVIFGGLTRLTESGYVYLSTSRTSEP